jgi:alpha-1,2-mannosyltransferase
VLKQRRNELGKTALLSALVAVVGSLYLVAILNAVPPHPDFDIYMRGVAGLVHGRPLYDAFLSAPGDPTLRYGFIYPPLFAMLVAPFGLLPGSIAPAAWLVGTQAALAVAFWLVARRLQLSRPLVLLAIASTLAFYPLWADGSQAQANLPILLLVTLGILGIVDDKPRAGVWIGLAAALKLTPGLLLVWMVWKRQFRAAAWTLAGFGALTAAAALIRPQDSMAYFGKVLPMLAPGTAYYSNQSIAGLFARLFSPNSYTSPLLDLSWERVVAIAAALGALGFWLWMNRSNTSDRTSLLAGAVTFLPLLPLMSSVSWEHHLVILLPLIWVALATPTTLTLSARGRERTGLREIWRRALFALGVICLLAIPHLPFGPPYGTDFARAAHTANPLQILGANRLLVGTLVLFFTAPWLVARLSLNRLRRPDRAPQPAAAA